MSDLISRQAAIEEIRRYITKPNISDDESEIKGFNDGLELAISVLSVLPSAQPEGCPFYVRNKHDRGDDSMCRLFHRETKYLAIETRQVGEWIDDKCSLCGQYVYHGDARNYCPRCGAYMMEGNNEVDHDRQAGQPDIGDAGVRS